MSAYAPPPIRSSVAERAARVRFRRATSLMLMTLLVPGSAQLVSGRRRLGLTAIGIWAGGIAVTLGTVLVAVLHHPFAFWVASSAAPLFVLRWGLTFAAIGWALLFVDAWRLGQPLTLRLEHRRAVVGINGALSLGVAAVLLFSAHIVSVQQGLMTSLFGAGAASAATGGRYNVLLLGGDAGKGRWGLRPDSINVASIDAETGRTVLISLPRNMQNFPFRPGSVMDKQFPDGFDCKDCYLNAVSTWALDHPKLFGKSKYPGVDATVMAVEGITGLDINYWAMVNLDGFQDLVDAVGGVELTVRDPIPIGLPSDDFYDHIEPGRRKLDGWETLWYARARQGSDDYSRMARQKCVLGAMLSQVSPQSALRNFSAIAEASSKMVATDIPASEVDTFLDLAMKARKERISSVSLVPPLINTARPDIDLARREVEKAIAKSEGRTAEAKPSAKSDGDRAAAAERPAPKRKKPATSQQTTGGSIGSLSEGYAANQAADLDAAC